MSQADITVGRLASAFEVSVWVYFLSCPLKLRSYSLDCSMTNYVSTPLKWNLEREKACFIYPLSIL